MSSKDEPPRGAEVRICGGAVTAGNIGGSGNRVRAKHITGGRDGAAELAELRASVAALAAELAGRGQDAALATERAEQLGAELAEPQPEGSRVHRLWQRLSASLDALKVGVDLAKLAEAIGHLF